MGLRPPIVRSRAGNTKSAPKATTSATHERAVRPVAERTGPLRTSDQLMRTEDGISPIGDAVSKAYQVFDRYLKEGREYAAGQSAWYNGEGALPNFAGGLQTALPALPAIPGMPNMPGMPQQDVLAAAIWLLDQLRASTPGAAAMAPLASAMSSVAKPGNWPMPQWPTTQAGSSKWTEERFDAEPSPKSKAIGAYNIDDQAARKSKFGFKS